MNRKSLVRAPWWTVDMGLIRRCFICGGRLVKRSLPNDTKKRLVCSSCFHITYLNPKSVAGLIPVASDGRIVLLRRGIEPALGKWSYPAGFQELGETVEQGAEREAWEEICVRARVTKLLGVYSYPEAGVVTIVYVGRLRAGEIPSAGHEATEVKLFKLRDIPWRELAFRSTREALQDFVRQKGRL